MGKNVALIGGGMVSKVHLHVMLSHPFVDSVSICETDPDKLDELVKQYTFKKTSTDYHKLLQDPEIDIIDICLPHHLHYPVTLEAFKAGKHVILEKPISNSLTEADDMIAAAEEAGKRFYVALNERFLPVHQRVKELIDQGMIGKPVMAALSIAGSELPRMQQPDHWKGTWGMAGGGVLADSGTHAIDLALNWFGEPEYVTCDWGRFIVQPANKADDTVSLILSYPDKLVSVYLTYAAGGQPWSEQRFVWGEHGSISVRVESDSPIQVWVDGKLIHQEVQHDAENWWAYSVKLGLQNAFDCFQYHRAFPVTPKDARDILRVIRAAYCSAALKRRIKINEIDGLSFSLL